MKKLSIEKVRSIFTFCGFLVLLLTVLVSCKKDVSSAPSRPADTTVVNTPAFDIGTINDTYSDVAPLDKYLFWGPYNVHDPSIFKAGDYYYSYSTDVGYGITAPIGIQIRRSKDLVQWQFIGWVFNGLPPMSKQFIQSKGVTPVQGLWAPYIMKHNNEYRLYYSLASVGRLSVIGMATATNPEGPWTEKGIVVTSLEDNTRQTNAIDPTVVVTPAGEHYMYYGSAWDGIYMLKLDAATGLAANSNDKGKRIANRGFTDGRYNGNIEGAEVIYNPELKKYFLFIAYDWLSTKYNVRVCRADSPEGPFIDYDGNDANTTEDHGPMILAPYKFDGHGGWQGVAHCSVFKNEGGQFFMGHQGRPGVSPAYMVLHVRKIFWTKDGWPVVSPERYAGESNADVPLTEITGAWEQIVLGYRIVPGYDQEQVSPDFQTSMPLNIGSNGTLNGDAGSTWTYNAPWLEMKWANGFTDKVMVQKGRDWENKKPTIIFTGLNNTGTAVWGKKK